MKKETIALLADAYLSPLLINTLIREGVPAYAQSKRLREELGIYCPDLILLDETEAANIIALPESLLYVNSDEALSTIRDFLKSLSETGICKSFENKSYLGKLLSKAFQDLGLRDFDKERIMGENFTCDAYFGANGEPAVLGIYAHPVLGEDDFRDVVYYTSQGVMRKMLPRMKAALKMLSSQLDIKNLPLHAEFRLQKNHLVTTEVNPWSFGKFSLPDLLFFAFGLNPYKQYFRGLKPDWDYLLPSAGDDIFFRVLSRLHAAVPSGKKPDHEEFADTFENLVGYCKLDPERYPAFSIAFGRTGDLEDVKKYLRMDFQDYFN